MPRNYGPTVNLGDERTRIPAGRFSNILHGPKTLHFEEEEVALVEDQRTGDHYERLLGRTGRNLDLLYNADTADSTILPLRNPLDDSIIPGQEITMQFAYAVLYALGRYAQTLCDAREEAASDSDDNPSPDNGDVPPSGDDTPAAGGEEPEDNAPPSNPVPESDLQVDPEG